MKLEQGDYLEVKCIDKIRRLIPSYEVIWGKYIGHDGNGRMIKLEELNETDNNDRETFAEHFYTCMESIICLEFILSEVRNNEINIEKHTDYLKTLNLFISFYGHCGRIIDNSEKMLNICGINNGSLKEQFKEVYELRNLILHGKKLPIFIIDGLGLIAPPTGREDEYDNWNSKKNWSEINLSNLTYIEDILNYSFEIVSCAYNNILGNLKDTILAIVKEKNINLDKTFEEISRFPSKDMSGCQGPISGSFSK